MSEISAETRSKADAIFRAYGCSGVASCARSRNSGCSNDFPCVGCPAPPSIFVDNTKVYRSFADYCDD